MEKQQKQPSGLYKVQLMNNYIQKVDQNRNNSFPKKAASSSLKSAFSPSIRNVKNR